MNMRGVTLWRPLSSGHLSMERVTGLAQGMYFVVTGLWPILSLRTFEAVTGPKVDEWLVKTVGALVTALGVPLLIASSKGHVAPELCTAAAGSAGALAAIDVVYVTQGRISRVYLADATIEIALVVGWLGAMVLRGRRHEARR